MKIGILTYHRVINEGSVLQAYCSQRWLSNRYPGASVEIIDYRPSFLEKREFFKQFRKRPPFLNFTEISKSRKINQFRNNKLSYTASTCQSDKLADAQDFIQRQGFEAICVGSDTVWEVRENGGAPLAPNIYFLPEINVKKLGFAVSMDQTDDNLLVGDRASKITRLINDFKYVGYRDQVTKSYLDNLGVNKKNQNFMPDPSLLWDFTELKEESSLNVHSNAKWVGVAVGTPSVRLKITKALVAKGFKVVNLLGLPVKGQIAMPHFTAYGEHLGLISKLNLMVTDRFHQSIMALRLSNAPIVFLENSQKYHDKPSKGRDLFNRLNVEFNIVTHDMLSDINERISGVVEQWQDRAIDGKALIAGLLKQSEKSIHNFDQSLK